MDASTYLRFILSLVLVLGMIFAAMWALRRWGAGFLNASPMGGGKSRRLALVESLSLDARHKLVLVRRDDCEHLLLLGADGDLLVEAHCAAPRFQLPPIAPETGP